MRHVCQQCHRPYVQGETDWRLGQGGLTCGTCHILFTSAQKVLPIVRAMK